jgi:hypothetical protein
MQDILKTVLVFVVGLLGGLLGASLIGGGDRAATAESSGGTGLDAVSATAFKGLEERLMLLEREAESQDLAMADFNARLLVASRRDAGPVASAASALDSNGNPELGSLSLTDVPTGPAFDAQVLAVVQQKEADEEAARELEREQRREERLKRTMDQLTTDLGLDARQAEVVGAALKESTMAREKFFEQMQGGNFDRETARAQMTQIRESEIAKVSAVLTPTQVESYTRTTDFGGGRGQGGGPGFGGGGQGRGGF